MVDFFPVTYLTKHRGDTILVFVVNVDVPGSIFLPCADQRLARIEDLNALRKEDVTVPNEDVVSRPYIYTSTEGFSFCVDLSLVVPLRYNRFSSPVDKESLIAGLVRRRGLAK